MSEGNDPTGEPPSPGARLRPLIKHVGVALTLAALAFVTYQIVTADWSRVWGRVDAFPLFGTAAAALVYGIAGFLLALAWWWLLAREETAPRAIAPVVAAYATTQIYKYLPTNVMHLVGRHALFRSKGVSHAALLSAAAMEVIGIPLAACAIAAASGWRLLAAHAPDINPHHAALATLAAIALVSGAGALAFFHRPSRRMVKRHGSMLAVAAPLYAVFLAVSGIVIYIVARVGLGLDAPAFLDLLAITTASWVLGFLVPGAPGGFGVREAAMIVMLSPLIGQADSVALALLYRVATTAGDGLFAVAGMAMWRRVSGRPGISDEDTASGRPAP